MTREKAEEIKNSFDKIQAVSQGDVEFLVRFYVANSQRFITREAFNNSRREAFPNWQMDHERLELLRWSYDFFMKR